MTQSSTMSKINRFYKVKLSVLKNSARNVNLFAIEGLSVDMDFLNTHKKAVYELGASKEGLVVHNENVTKKQTRNCRAFCKEDIMVICVMLKFNYLRSTRIEKEITEELRLRPRPELSI